MNNAMNKEEIIAIHQKCVGLKVFCTTLGGWHGEIKSIKDENTFVVQSNSGRLIDVDLFDLRGLDSEIAPVVQNDVP